MARKAANNVNYDKNNGIWKVEKDKSKRASKTPPFATLRRSFFSSFLLSFTPR